MSLDLPLVYVYQAVKTPISIFFSQICVVYVHTSAYYAWSSFLSLLNALPALSPIVGQEETWTNQAK